MNELKSLSTNDAFKLSICDILRSLSDKNFNEFGQDGYRISILTSHILYPSLIMTENPLIKQNVFEVIEKLARTGKQDVVREVMKSSQNVQGEINNYLQRNNAVNGFPKEYYGLLSRAKFEHQCCVWRECTNSNISSSKKIKIDDAFLNIQSVPAQHVLPNNPLNNQKTKPVAVNTDANKSKSYGSSSSIPRVTSEEVTGDNVTEAICSIRGEVKCLTNLLKTEKLSAKNVADLRIIVSQLSSLM